MFDFLSKKDRTPPALPQGTELRRYITTGQVQGVGFRYRARYAAQTLDLTGWVQNEDDGSVTLEVQGDPDKFISLFAMIQKSDYIQITGIRQKQNAGHRGVRRSVSIILYFHPSTLRGEFSTHRVLSSRRVTASRPFAVTRAGSRA